MKNCFVFIFSSRRVYKKGLHNINCQNMLLGIGLSKLTALPKVIKGDYSSHISASCGSTTELQIFKFLFSKTKTNMSSRPRQPVGKGGLWASSRQPVSKETQELLKGILYITYFIPSGVFNRVL